MPYVTSFGQTLWDSVFSCSWMRTSTYPHTFIKSWSVLLSVCLCIWWYVVSVSLRLNNWYKPLVHYAPLLSCTCCLYTVTYQCWLMLVHSHCLGWPSLSCQWCQKGAMHVPAKLKRDVSKWFRFMGSEIFQAWTGQVLDDCDWEWVPKDFAKDDIPLILCTRTKSSLHTWFQCIASVVHYDTDM